MMGKPPREDDVFRIAISLPSQELREEYLRQACGGDASFHDRVTALLDAHREEPDFLESPLAGVAATINSLPVVERPGSQIGPYELIQEIGEGGMGIVFLALQREPVRRKVALKIIKPGLDTRALVARFEAEEQALALMDHPNIAKVHDAGTTDSDRPYFVMELVDGVPITEYCDDNNLTTRERLELFVLLCSAVQHAHQKGIIHRDIKPSNVLVTLHDGVPVPKIIDFGIAKATNQELTSKTLATGLGHMIGTPLYMSPEQAERSGLDIDTRSDIYSLGVLLYELLTGTTPFDRDQLKDTGLDEVRRLIREQEPPRPSTRITTLGKAATTVSEHRKTDPVELSNSLRHELDWIVMKALEKDRTRRYETANDFARDVLRYLNDEPVEAYPPSAVYRLGKFVRRNKTSVVATIVVGLALIIGITVSVGQAIRATKAEKLSDEGAKRERQLREEAETLQKQAETVTDYIVEVFRSPDPVRNGRTVTVAEMLDKANDRLDRELPNDSPMKAHMLRAIGQTYNALNLPQEAVVLLQRARQIDNDVLGGENRETLRSMAALVTAYINGGQYDQALELGHETFTSMSAILGKRDVDTLDAMSTLAKVYIELRDHERAIALLAEVVPLQRQLLGVDNYATLQSTFKLAEARAYAGKWREALEDRKQLLALATPSLGPEHPLTISVRQTFEESLNAAGQFRSTITAGTETLRLAEKVLGDDDPVTLLTLNSLGCAYEKLGQGEASLGLLETAATRWSDRFGPYHQYTYLSAGRLAKCYYHLGRLEQAITLLERTLKRPTADAGPKFYCEVELTALLSEVEFEAGDHTRAESLLQQARRERSKVIEVPTRDASIALVRALSKLGYHEEAVELLRETLSNMESVFGENNHQLCLPKQELVNLYCNAAQTAKATAACSDLYELTDKALGAQHPEHLAAALLFGSLQRESHDYGQAESLLEEAYRGYAQRQVLTHAPMDAAQCCKTLDELVKLCEALNRPDKAAAWQEKLDALNAEKTKDDGDN